MIAAILPSKDLRLNEANEVERLISLEETSKYRLTGEAAESLIQRREALGAVLDIFSGSNKLRKSVLKSWALDLDNVLDRNEEKLEAELSSDKGASTFLSGIQARHIQKESTWT